MTEEKPESIDDLMKAAYKGRDASAAKGWLEPYLWMRIWKATMAVAMCPPEMLVEKRSDLKAHILIAQELNLDVSQAEYAAGKIKALYSKKEEITGG